MLQLLLSIIDEEREALQLEISKSSFITQIVSRRQDEI
jgi:hypothetical protein